MKMKAILSFSRACLLACLVAMPLMAQAEGDDEFPDYADIKFDTTSINLGTLTDKEPKKTVSFKFTNTGTAPLIINQAHASCGCTVATFTKDPVQPGESGTIDVTYNSKGQYPGHFKKTISVRTNAKQQMVRLSIEGSIEGDK